MSARKFQGDSTPREAYARVALLQHCRAVKEKRTRVAKPDIEGRLHFAEAFNFRCAPAHLSDTSLAFHVFQATPGYDKLIGKVVLGSYMFVRGKALTQWNTAIANPMEHCQQWHALTE